MDLYKEHSLHLTSREYEKNCSECYEAVNNPAKVFGSSMNYFDALHHFSNVLHNKAMTIKNWRKQLGILSGFPPIDKREADDAYRQREELASDNRMYA